MLASSLLLIAIQISSFNRYLPLKAMAWNPCSTVSPARMQEISVNFADAAIGILNRTKVQMSFEDHIHIEQTSHHDVLHMGWNKEAQKANRSCRVAIMLNKKHSFKRHTVYSDPGPVQLRGRFPTL